MFGEFYFAFFYVRCQGIAFFLDFGVGGAGGVEL